MFFEAFQSRFGCFLSHFQGSASQERAFINIVSYCISAFQMKLVVTQRSSSSCSSLFLTSRYPLLLHITIYILISYIVLWVVCTHQILIGTIGTGTAQSLITFSFSTKPAVLLRKTIIAVRLEQSPLSIIFRLFLQKSCMTFLLFVYLQSNNSEPVNTEPEYTHQGR